MKIKHMPNYNKKRDDNADEKKKQLTLQFIYTTYYIYLFKRETKQILCKKAKKNTQLRKCFLHNIKALYIKRL